jgi:uncharacterized protein (TIGR03032 family)
MPHSPRWHNGRLWLLNSGAGYLGYVENEQFSPVALLPGYARGLALIGEQAVIGLSRPRHNRTFDDLPIDAELSRHHEQPRCGVQIVDLTTGATAHWLRIEGVVEELYDVVTLPGVTRPMALGFKTNEIQRMISIEQD